MQRHQVVGGDVVGIAAMNLVRQPPPSASPSRNKSLANWADAGR